MPAAVRNRQQGLVDQLTASVRPKAVNHVISLQNYYRSADLLLSQAALYRSSSNDEQLYVMLMRLASLLVETVPRHRDYVKGSVQHQRYDKYLRERGFPELERLKVQLRLKEAAQQPVARSTHRPPDAVQLRVAPLPELDWSSTQPAPSAPGVSAEALHEEEEAVQSRQQYGDQRYGGAYVPPSPPSTSYAVTSQQSLHKHALYASAGAAGRSGSNSSSGGSGAWAQVPQRPRYPGFDSTPAAPIDLLWERPGADSGGGERAANGMPAPALPDMSSLSLNGTRQQQQQQGGSLMDAPIYMQHPSAGPSLGPQEVGVHGMDPSLGTPGGTCSHAPNQQQQQQQAVVVAGPEPGGPKPLPKRGADLRDVHISVALMNDFLHFAAANTRRGIETCGILAGTLSAGDSVFTITTLIVPKQEGTSDTVAALNEEEIYEAQASRELYPLGWIHTHPTQTCFLSSIDVHTQCGYQTMLDEAVAVVMAPTDPSNKCGIFRLSTPGGLGLVQRCPQRGFHQHPPTDTAQPVYELCGHVYLHPRVKHSVIDLRG